VNGWHANASCKLTTVVLPGPAELADCELREAASGSRPASKTSCPEESKKE